MFASTRDYILIANFVGMALLPFLLLAALNFKLYATIKVLITTRLIVPLLAPTGALIVMMVYYISGSGSSSNFSDFHSVPLCN